MSDLSCACQTRWHHQRWASLREHVASDIQRFLTKSAQNIALGDSAKRRLSAWLTPELQCLTLHRIAHWLHVNRWRRLALACARLNFLLYKVSLTPRSCIGPGCRLSHPAAVVFDGIAGRDLTIFGVAICRPSVSAQSALPVLGDAVTLGAHSVILGPLTIGNSVRVSPSAVLRKDVPHRTLVVSHALHVTLRPSA